MSRSYVQPHSQLKDSTSPFFRSVCPGVPCSPPPKIRAPNTAQYSSGPCFPCNPALTSGRKGVISKGV